MADQKISALTEVTTPNASDKIPVVNSGVTKNVQIQNAVKVAPAIWARVFHNAAQSINSATDTVLAFNSERNDTDTIHDNSTNNSRLTCKTAGLYSIKFCVDFDANATGFRAANIKLNGTTYIGGDKKTAISGSSTRCAGTTDYILAVNDYVQIEVHQTSGGALNVASLANLSPEFMMTRLGA